MRTRQAATALAGWGVAAARATAAARWLGHFGTRLGGGALDALLPPQCLTCDQPVRAQGELCVACFRLTGFVTAPFCQRCASPMLHAGQLVADAAGVPCCARCLAAPPAWDRARAALRYDDQGRHLILALKHADRLELARPLARMMARAGADLLARADLIVPVPLHPGRLRRRRYNQAALLARALGTLAGRAVLPDALCRVRRTASLGRLGVAARAEIVAGAFAVRERRRTALTGARIVLVDDVLTSGATAGACAATLRHAGVAGVDVLVAARVPDPRLG